MQNLLRPEQRKEMLEERSRMLAQLQSPHIEDKGAVTARLRRVDKQLEDQTPKPFKGVEVDTAVKRERELRAAMLPGMPSMEEMRKNPPGAVGKHMDWERRNKKKLLEWKNLQLRLNSDSDDPDVANFEKYRPARSSLNMDNAQISGTAYFMPPDSPQYRENYDRIFGQKDRKPPKPKRKGRQWTPEQREALRKRMNEINERKRAKE